MLQICDMGQDGFYFPSEEGVLRIFSPWKIRRIRPGLNPRTWVPKTSTLSLDHRSPFVFWGLIVLFIFHNFIEDFTR
jgi:hypothetical protein